MTMSHDSGPRPRNTQARRFWVEGKIFELFPGLHLVGAVAMGIDNRDHDGRIDTEWEASWNDANRLAACLANAQSHPNVAAWRRALKKIGVSYKDFPSSIEAMLRRAMSGAAPLRINPAVDMLHAISLRHLVPAGAFDLKQISQDVALRTTYHGDTFEALDAAEPIPVGEGEVAYADGHIILTRHFVWRQAKHGLVNHGSSDVFFVAEVLPELGVDAPGDVVGDLSCRLRDQFGVSTQTFMLNEAKTSFDW